MKGQPLEVSCRGGSLHVQESRAVRHGTVAWALWRSQISGAGCVLETAGDDEAATVYLHLRDGRRFAVEDVAPRECFRVFELLGYEPEPGATAGGGQAPVVIDLGDKHTRVISSASDMTLEQDGHALLTLPCDQLLGVRVTAREDAAKVQIVAREGFVAQLDGVPFEIALRLLIILGAAPREIVQLERPKAPPVSSERDETRPEAAEPVAERGPEPTIAVPNRPVRASSRVISRRRPTGKGSAVAMHAAAAMPERSGARARASSADSKSASDGSRATHPPPVAQPRQHDGSPGAAAPSPQSVSANARPTLNGTSAAERDTAARAIRSLRHPATPKGSVATVIMATTTSPLSITKSERPRHDPSPAGQAASELEDGTALPGAVLATASPSAAAEAEVVAPDAAVTPAARAAPAATTGLPLAGPPHSLSEPLLTAADAGSDSLPPRDTKREEQGGFPLASEQLDTQVARGHSTAADATDSVREAARLLWHAVLAAIALRLTGAHRLLSWERFNAAARHAMRTSRFAARATGDSRPSPLAASLILEHARTLAGHLSARAHAGLGEFTIRTNVRWRQRALTGALAALAVLVLSTAGDALVVRMAAPSHHRSAVPVAPRTADLVPSRDPVPRTGVPASVVYAGSQDGALYALDASSGALLWRYDAGSPVEGGPIVVGGVIYAGEADGTIVALRMASHRDMWRYHTGGSVHGAPVVVDGVVYAGSSDDHLYALQASDGTLLWRFTARDRFAGTPTVTGDIVYAGTNDGTLYALRASDGAEVWQVKTGGTVTVAPVIVDGVVYAGSSDDKLYALDARTGAIRWWYSTGGSLYATPEIANGVVYVGSSDSNVYALRATDGRLQWSTRTGAQVLAPAVVDGQTVYVTSSAGLLYALRASDGTPQWRYATQDSGVVVPAIASGTVYVGSGDSSVSALDVQNGTLRWSYRTNGRVTSSLIGISGS